MEEDLDEELVSFADEMGLFFEDMGNPRAWGRLMGWLLVCESEFQSAEDFANVLHGSRGSVSMTTRALIRGGTVERRTLPGAAARTTASGRGPGRSSSRSSTSEPRGCARLRSGA